MNEVLTLKLPWLEPGFVPDTLYESPFVGFGCVPRFADVAKASASFDHTRTSSSLEAYAGELVAAVDGQLAMIEGPIHCLLSGGYDSRLLAFLLERAGKKPLYVTDGTEEPECGDTLDYLGVPRKRRYVHDLEQPDPYGLTKATPTAYAPLYFEMGFFPADDHATLVTGLGGGEWFSYPAGGWHAGKKHRLPHSTVVNAWLDCWPQYATLPDAWARGYAGAVHPYCTPDYARVAARVRREWLYEVDPAKALDAVRKAMLDSVDEGLAGLGWVPHDYDWRLSQAERDEIDERYAPSWLGRTFTEAAVDGRPSDMDLANHACTLAGFATWCDQLVADGHRIVV